MRCMTLHTVIRPFLRYTCTHVHVRACTYMDISAWHYHTLGKTPIASNIRSKALLSYGCACTCRRMRRRRQTNASHNPSDTPVVYVYILYAVYDSTVLRLSSSPSFHWLTLLFRMPLFLRSKLPMHIYHVNKQILGDPIPLHTQSA